MTGQNILYSTARLCPIIYSSRFDTRGDGQRDYGGARVWDAYNDPIMARSSTNQSNGAVPPFLLVVPPIFITTVMLHKFRLL